jgi:hypothetical protein
VLAEPVEAFEETVTTHGTGGLDEPGATADGVEAKLVGDLGAAHGSGQVLLVGEDEENGVLELLFGKHLVELVTVLFNTLLVVGVNHEDEALGVEVVVAPEETDLVLTSDVPHVEGDVLVFDGLHIEANGGDGVDDLAKLELVENGGLTCGIKADHKNTHLFGSDHARPHFSKHTSHFDYNLLSRPAFSF